MIRVFICFLMLTYIVKASEYIIFMQVNDSNESSDKSSFIEEKIHKIPDRFNLKKTRQGINYKDCGSETGKITEITVTNCNQLPCIFERGQNYTLNLNFNSLTDTKSVQNHVYGIIANIPIPFKLPNEDGCSMGVSCPVKNGQQLTESVTLPILSEYPKISLVVKWQVTDEKNKQMVCFQFPVKIQ